MAGPSLRKSRDVLGIELDEHHLKMVHLQQRGIRREFSNLLIHPVREGCRVWRQAPNKLSAENAGHLTAERILP